MNTPTLDFGYSQSTDLGSAENSTPNLFYSNLEKNLHIASNYFKSVWLCDHLNYTNEFRLECWTLLTWIASRFPQLDLGALVLCNSFRNPSMMAKMATTIQYLSNNRLILGYGAGWHEGEYKAFGFEYPNNIRRIEMLAEAIQVIKMLWTKNDATFSGEYYQINSANCEPKPKKIPPIMIGGAGEKYTLQVVAEYADWWNLPSSYSIDEVKHKLKVLEKHCMNKKRDFSKIRKTMATRILIDKSHSKAKERIKSEAYVTDPAIVGDPVYITEQLAQRAKLGFDLCIVIFESFQIQEDMKLFAEKVIPNFQPTTIY